MANKCDLEEMKHLAVQKFLELADSKAMEDSCKKIQAALAPPPAREPSLYERVKRLFK